MKLLRRKWTAGLKRLARGFTMIELLMVVSILCVLVALLVPTIRIAVGKTETVKCLNNLRSIGQGMLLYASDRGGFPYSSHYDYWADWGESIIPYMISNPKFVWHPESWPNGLWQETTAWGWVDRNYSQSRWNFFTCPSGPKPLNGASITYAHNYSCNEWLMPNNHNSYLVAGRPAPQVAPGGLSRPGSLILICDSGAMDNQNGDASDTCYQFKTIIENAFVASPNGEQANGYTACTTPAANDTDLAGLGIGWPIYIRHQGRCNALMADGHVQAFANGEIKRRNWVSSGLTKEWGAGVTNFIRAKYP